MELVKVVKTDDNTVGKRFRFDAAGDGSVRVSFEVENALEGGSWRTGGWIYLNHFDRRRVQEL